MKDNFIHVAFVIDESGSMTSSESDVVGGFKKMVDEQKEVKDGKCAISLYKFNDKVTKVFLGKDLDEIGDLDYYPCGMTAMNDGIGTAIDEIGKWLSDMDESERPSKNLIVIITDGLENSSKEYSFTKVKEMISHQEEKYNWSFVYLGADINNLKDANSLGFKMRSVASKKDLGSTYKMINCASTTYRCSLNKSSADSELKNYLNYQTTVMLDEYEAKNNVKVKKD